MKLYQKNFNNNGMVAASCVHLECSSEEEFNKIYDKIKHIPGTKMSGCPADEPGCYDDQICFFARENNSVSQIEDRAYEQIEKYREVLS